jgi:hypothetical protein
MRIDAQNVKWKEHTGWISQIKEYALASHNISTMAKLSVLNVSTNVWNVNRLQIYAKHVRIFREAGNIVTVTKVFRILV